MDVWVFEIKGTLCIVLGARIGICFISSKCTDVMHQLSLHFCQVERERERQTKSWCRYQIVKLESKEFLSHIIPVSYSISRRECIELQKLAETERIACLRNRQLSVIARWHIFAKKNRRIPSLPPPPVLALYIKSRIYRDSVTGSFVDLDPSAEILPERYE